MRPNFDFAGVESAPPLCSTLRQLLSSFYDLSERVPKETLTALVRFLRDPFETREAEGIIANKDRYIT